MALLVAFLVLAAQYESWTSPVAAVMGLPVALLGAMLGCHVMGTAISIYTQIGIILLVALSAKNGILIVEFARDYPPATYSDDIACIRIRGYAAAFCNRSRGGKPYCTGSRRSVRYGTEYLACHGLYS